MLYKFFTTLDLIHVLSSTRDIYINQSVKSQLHVERQFVPETGIASSIKITYNNALRRWPNLLAFLNCVRSYFFWKSHVVLCAIHELKKIIPSIIKEVSYFFGYFALEQNSSETDIFHSHETPILYFVCMLHIAMYHSPQIHSCRTLTVVTNDW